jgi:hypothetical protein
MSDTGRRIKRRIQGLIRKNYFLETLITSSYDLVKKSFRHHEPVHVYAEQKCVYFPIQKAANTSINYAFLNKEQEIEPSTSNIGKEKRKSKEPYRKAVGLEYFKFSFVRNPFTRLVSCYRDKIQDRSSVTKKYFGYLRGLSFENFIKTIDKIPVRYMDRHFKPQYTTLQFKGELQPDYIGRVEMFETDFKVLQEKFDLETPPKINSRKKDKEWHEYYTEEIAHLVYTNYKQDFELWYPDAYDELRKLIQ